LVKAPGRARLG